MKTAIVLGSTGLVGSELVKCLQASPHYRSILLLSRRPSGYRESKVSERIIDFDSPNLAGITGDDLYCALGTTARKAGSEAALQRIDCEYPTTIATRLRKQGGKRILLVSSVGANPNATGLYLRTKGKLEENILALDFEQTVIARPSFLTGRKGEFRLGEEVAIFLVRLLSPLLFGPLRKYRAIEANQVARCLVQAADVGIAGVQFIEYDQMQASG